MPTVRGWRLAAIDGWSQLRAFIAFATQSTERQRAKIQKLDEGHPPAGASPPQDDDIGEVNLAMNRPLKKRRPVKSP